MFTLEVKFPKSDSIDLFAILWVFLVDLGNWIEFFGFFIEASSEIEEKLNIWWDKRRCAWTCIVYVNIRGKNHNHF